jgi:glycosyltransferase involved in cell wall biosynthesis
MEWVDPFFVDFKSAKDWIGDFDRHLKSRAPTLIHIQHEFGLFGSKVPPFYQFTRRVDQLRRKYPSAKIVATAHTVLDRNFKYDWKVRGRVQALSRWLSNYSWVPLVRPTWMEKTWGILDGVIVHSRHQRAAVEESRCPLTEVIPHYVPSPSFGGGRPVPREAPKILADIPADLPLVVVFGFFSPEKGQDIALEAFSQLKTPAHLIFAGGARRKEDQGYLDRCRERIAELGLQKRLKITGFVEADQLDPLFRRADLVLAPFRQTSGSGSLAQALARGCAILASDLLLNQEVNERVGHSLATFAALDPEDCAHKMDELLTAQAVREDLKANSLQYAARFSPREIALAHFSFYQRLSGA